MSKLTARDINKLIDLVSKKIREIQDAMKLAPFCYERLEASESCYVEIESKLKRMKDELAGLPQEKDNRRIKTQPNTLTVGSLTSIIQEIDSKQKVKGKITIGVISNETKKDFY